MAGIVHIVGRLVLLSMAAQLVVESLPWRPMTARAYEMVFSNETITDFTTGAIDVASLITQDWLSLPLGGSCGLAAKYITPHTFNTSTTRGTLHTTFEYLTQECTAEYKHDINTCALLNADFAVCLGFPLDSRTSHRPWGYCSNQNSRVSYLWVPHAISNYTTTSPTTMATWNMPKRSQMSQSNLQISSLVAPSLPSPSVPVPSLPSPSVPVPSLPSPSVPVPSVPVPSLPSPSVPVPSVPVPSLPSPSVPVPSVPVPSLPSPSVPVPSVPVPSVTVPSVPAPSVPVPSLPTPSVPVPSLPTPSDPVPSLPTPSLPVPSVPAPSVPPVCLSHGQANKTATDPVALAKIYKDVPTLNRVVEATGSRIGAEFAATNGRSCDWRHSNLIPVAWDGIQNVLMAGQSLLSPDGTYSLTMQYDCNLVVYKKRPDGTIEWNAKWASFSHFNDPFQHECFLELQPNGNLVVRDPSGEQRWSSGSTAPSLYSTALSVISCGNVIVLDMTTGAVIWATHTGHA